ncbi:MAG: LamG-like jellyroll fold domain-containing protein [Flavobacteriaceae bacterium]|nr:T9SS type A sorting domain-containing protein [Flavobacteriaceae bacterium]
MEKKYFSGAQILFVLSLIFITSISYAQVMQLEVIGGNVVTQGSTVTINAGNSLNFRITNIETNNCRNLKIEDVDISNTTDFGISPNNPKGNIKPEDCPGGKKEIDFDIYNISSSSCSTVSTLVTIEIKNQSDFTFTLQVNSSPEIYVFGADYPYGEIFHGDTTTSADNNTYFGVVDEGNVVTRRYAVANIGSCDLDITALSSTNSDFDVTSPYTIPFTGLDPYYYIVIDVAFTAPVAGTGTQTSTISISNNDNTTFTFDVSAEMFNENIPGPGGITADFRLWLKSTRGVVQTSSKVSEWKDLGTNGKDAVQPVSSNQPTYLDTATDNINFNPVIKFENNGSSLEQYLYNTTNGFYSQDIFIIMIPDAAMTNTTSRNTIFAGVSSGSTGDITGVGFGDYSSEFTNETLSYNQNIPGGGSFNGTAEIGSSYSNAGIINIRNNAASSPTGQDILYNSNVLTTSNVNDIGFANVGLPGPPTVTGTKYWIGRNFDIQGSLNGRVAEIFTFAERVSDNDRQKIESYLGIKYGITLGSSTEATKDYINSFDTSVWDISANSGYNYDVAGIGRDSISDLNQKQSKSINYANAVAIGLGGISDTNSANSNEFIKDGDFLVWGNNNGAFSGTNTNSITIGTGITTSVTRIDRQWKIVETNEDVNGDVKTVFVSIPSAAFSSFTKLDSEEYALIVADNGNFADGDIIDVIPLRSDGGSNLYTWYNFDETKYFTFGKTSKWSENHSISIASGDFLVGEYELNLNVDSFTISAWIKTSSNASTRTIMAKGEKLQIRLNSSDQVEVMIDDTTTPKYISDMIIGDGKWHQLTLVYDSASIYLYVDGVLDKSVQDVVHPSPNYNHFSIGAIYIDKDDIINPFLGEIDEVYIWDLALSEEQIRYLMNQEIERFEDSGTDYVSGKVLPQASASNPIGTIPWSNLRVYYDFNSFYGSTVEGLTDERYFLRIKQLSKSKTILDDQTVPVPYISAADGSWDDVSTWSNNNDVIVPNTLGLDDSTNIDWNIVQTTHNITSGFRDIKLLGLKNNTGKITIANPIDNQDETNSGQSLTVTHYLEIDGVVDLVGESQLIQTEGSVLDTDSGGFIERDQQGTANGFNYNYWSSSVSPIAGNTATRGTGVSSTNTNHTISGFLNDGTISSSYGTLTFASSYAAADSDTPTTPRTLSTYWMYKYYGPTNDYYAWSSIDENSSILPGEGYTMKGTSGSADISSTFQNYVFKGRPNNGDITLQLDKSSGDVDRLVGNPYPSAIDATEFILDNLHTSVGGNNATGTVFNGALYFWDHFGEENSHNIGDYVGGYATRNLTGGAAAISNDSRINNTSDNGNPATGTKVPGEYIAVNQGFFVTTALDGFDDGNSSSLVTIDGGDIVFKNSQRAFVRENTSTSIFLNPNDDALDDTFKTTSNSDQVIGNTPTIRLVYHSPKGYHRQIVLGVEASASNDFDLGYDAFMIDVNEEDMYWVLADNKFVIQGVNNFNASQEFNLGLIVNEAGNIKIELDALRNVETNLNLFIKDNLTGETHKINDKAFEMYLEPGEYNERFKLVFQSEILSVNDNHNEDDNIIYYDSITKQIKVISVDELSILDATLYNIIGQSITELVFSSDKISQPLNVNSGVYIVQLNTPNGFINRKLIIN